jgi:hypothetical protein
VTVLTPSDPAAGVKLTEQASVPDPGRAQLPGEKVPLPPEKLTVPLGRIAVPASVSETVAVHVVDAFTGTDEGAQLTEVEVVRGFAATVLVSEEKPWSTSPPYVAVMW